MKNYDSGIKIYFGIFNVATVEELMKETADVVKWDMLALNLGIKSGIIEKIEAEWPSNINKAKLKMFIYWVENDLEASWKKLTTALQNIDKLVLAKQISDKIEGE